jgi:deoxyuridine 5'-triphosphate nucleotidohydrolase
MSDQVDNHSDNNGNDVVKFRSIGGTIPTRATKNSAGFDLYASEDKTIVGGEGSTLVKTGVQVQLPPGHYGRIAPRSGLAYKEHIAVNAGVIDIDYTGDIGVILYCTKNGHCATVKRGDRIAQLIIEKISYADGIEVKEFDDHPGFIENHSGFGSTGR